MSGGQPDGDEPIGSAVSASPDPERRSDSLRRIVRADKAQLFRDLILGRLIGMPSAADEFAGLASKLTPEEAELLADFLSTVQQSEYGYAIEDMMFHSAEALAEHFLRLYGVEADKGLYNNTVRWATSKTSFSVCWTSDSNASAAERTALRNVITATWGAYVNIAFTWNTTGVASPGTGCDIAIFHDSDITRGCAAVGTGQSARTGIDCTAGTAGDEHTWASMVQPTGGALDWRENTYVHEFGHALALEHEHRRAVCVDCSTGANETEALGTNVTTHGNYDPNSVMNYCACPIQGRLSQGDAAVGRFLFSSRSDNVEVTSRAWYTTSVVHSTNGANWTQSSVTKTPVNVTSQTSVVAGASYTFTSTPANAKLRCSVAKPIPPRIKLDLPLGVPDFAAQRIRVECYDPATLVTAAL